MGKILFLGLEGSGKSTLTAAIATYLAKRANSGWTMRPENKEAFAFSQKVIPNFNSGVLPTQTFKFRHLIWSLCDQGEVKQTFEILDYPGEVYRAAFMDAADEPNPAAVLNLQKSYAAEIKELLAYLTEAEEIFLLFNLKDIIEDENKNSSIDTVWLTYLTLKFLYKLKERPNIHFLISQIDRLKDLGLNIGDPRKLLDKYAALLGQHFPELKVGGVSAWEEDDKNIGIRAILKYIIPSFRTKAELEDKNKREKAEYDIIVQKCKVHKIKGDLTTDLLQEMLKTAQCEKTKEFLKKEIKEREDKDSQIIFIVIMCVLVGLILLPFLLVAISGH